MYSLNRCSNRAVLFSMLLVCSFVLSQFSLAQESETRPNNQIPPMNRRGMMRGPGMMQGMNQQGMVQGPGLMPRPMKRRIQERRLGEKPRIGREGRLLAMLHRPEVRKELGITDEQLKKLDDIAFNSAKSTIQDRAALQVNRLELRRLMRAENPDRAAIDKKLQDIAQSQAALGRSRVNERLDARGVLSKEQRAKLAEGVRRQLRQRQGLPAPEAAPKQPVRPRPAQPAAPAQTPVAPRPPAQ